jgi:hypothetical protein
MKQIVIRYWSPGAVYYRDAYEVQVSEANLTFTLDTLAMLGWQVEVVRGPEVS